MEELLTTMRNRRSVRKFLREKVPSEELELLVEAARWAPSAGNCQPWQFITVTDNEVIEAIKMISPGLFGDPPSLIIMCLNRKRLKATIEFHYIDLGAAMQNILLMAHSRGLGCCPIASFDGDALIELLSVSREIEPVLLVIVGYPDQTPVPFPRLPLDEILERF